MLAYLLSFMYMLNVHAANRDTNEAWISVAIWWKSEEQIQNISRFPMFNARRSPLKKTNKFAHFLRIFILYVICVCVCVPCQYYCIGLGLAISERYAFMWWLVLVDGGRYTRNDINRESSKNEIRNCEFWI